MPSLWSHLIWWTCQNGFKKMTRCCSVPISFRQVGSLRCRSAGCRQCPLPKFLICMWKCMHLIQNVPRRQPSSVFGPNGNQCLACGQQLCIQDAMTVPSTVPQLQHIICSFFCLLTFVNQILLYYSVNLGHDSQFWVFKLQYVRQVSPTVQ